ncbi:hypothetical protein ACA593_05200 [Lactiplantibacillus pentosus]|uniref:hypothetical protein n=1 Tax=Lactiplantibacillus pentosus TaxID=1589 RepID=UPI001ADD639E|nr:hypothetical protein [Lactiplantibacillus pentosus]MBO9164090.1 hypothetical protein [Lactiplantibacillus pentosus]
MKYFKSRLIMDKRYWLMSLLFVIVINIDLLLLVKQRFSFSGQFLTFLAGSSLGHYPQMALLWILPAYLLVGPSRWYLQDVKVSQINLLTTRMRKSQYLQQLLRTSFISVATSALLALLLNYGLALLIFRNGSGNSYRMSDFQDGSDPFLYWQLLHPVFANLLTILLAAMILGLIAMAIMALSFIFKQIGYVFGLSMVAWVIPISTNYSILSVLQPFQDTSLAVQVMVLLAYIIVLLGVIYVGYRNEVHRDEL